MILEKLDGHIRRRGNTISVEFGPWVDLSLYRSVQVGETKACRGFERVTVAGKMSLAIESDYGSIAQWQSGEPGRVKQSLNAWSSDPGSTPGRLTTTNTHYQGEALCGWH